MSKGKKLFEPFLYIPKIGNALIVMCAMLLLPVELFPQNSLEKETIISVERVWDRAEHNAFSSLINHNNKFYCAFREGSGHIPGINGTIRVIVSNDGQNWNSAAHLSLPGIDLRDPKLSVTPGNRIMLNIGGSEYIGSKLIGMKPLVSFSDSTGLNFSKPAPIIISPQIKTGKDWLWKATWHLDVSYATVYQPVEGGIKLQLVKSNDGVHYSHVTTLNVPGNPNETSLQFSADGSMVAIVRREGSSNKGFIGNSNYPYKNWEWVELDGRLGGPDFVFLPNNKLLCGTRAYNPNHETKMVLALINTAGGFYKLLELPSGGDCSYPGFVIKDRVLYISYYSSHEGKTSIYIAKVSLPSLEKLSGLDITPEPFVKYNKQGVVELECAISGGQILYTLNGELPSLSNGKIYNGVIEINNSSLLRARAFHTGMLPSNILSIEVGTDIYQDALDINDELKQGMSFNYYEGSISQVSDIDKMKREWNGTSSNISLLAGPLAEQFAVVYNGYIKIPEDGQYTFFVSSNDGSVLYLNESKLIDNDGAHGERELSRTVALRKGLHKIALDYFQMGGGMALNVYWKGPGFGKVEIPGKVFFISNKWSM